MEKSKEHRGHGAFGVGGSAAPDLAVTLLGGEGFDGHAVHGDCVEMRAEEDAGAIVRTGSASDEIGTVGEYFFESDGKAPRGEERGEVGSHFGFARKRGVGNGVGIDGGDANEVLQESGDGHGRGNFLQEIRRRKESGFCFFEQKGAKDAKSVREEIFSEAEVGALAWLQCLFSF